MARIWKQKGDANRDRKHAHAGVSTLGTESSMLYCVRVCGFTFEFTSVDEISRYLEFYSSKVHPSSREPMFTTTNLCHETGQWERWWERLPLYLQEEPKRQKVVEALATAIAKFSKEADPSNERVHYVREGRSRII